MIVRRVWVGVYNDGFIHAGNLAYMTLLAIFPFFIAAAAVFVLVGDQGQRETSIDAILVAVPPSVARVIGPAAHDALAAREGWLLWAGALLGLWTGSSLVETIRDILHRAYGTPATKAFWHYRLASTGMIFGSVVLLQIAITAQIGILTAQQVIEAYFPRFDELSVQFILSHAVSAGVLFTSIYLLFRSLTPEPYRRSPYPKWPGALIITSWWLLVTLVLPKVLSHVVSYNLTYGSLAGAMIALFFFWLVELGIVVGAELNAALAETPEEREMLAQGG